MTIRSMPFTQQGKNNWDAVFGKKEKTGPKA